MPADLGQISMLAIGMTTAPRVPSLADQSLRELRRAGFQQTVHVFAEPGAQIADHANVVVHRNPRPLGMWPNWRRAAVTLLAETDATHFLLCEDDFLLAEDASRRLNHAIESLPQENWGYASLYTARNSVRGRKWLLAGWQSLPPAASLWGSQAYCFTRESLRQMLFTDSIWQHAGNTGTDAIITLAMGKLGRKCYFHMPSLLEHVGNYHSTAQHMHPGNFSVGFCSRGSQLHSSNGESPPLHVGVLLPFLRVGGVEYWLLGNLRSSTPDRIRWSVALTSTENDPAMVRQVEEHARVYYGLEGASLAFRQADVVVTWGIPELRHWLGDFRGPVVATSHDTEPWMESYFRSVRSESTHFVAVSELARAAAAPAVPADLIRVIPNGVEQQRCQAQRTRREVREEWGLAEHEIAVGYMGRFAHKKNVQAMLRGVKRLGAPYRCVLVGYDFDGPLTAEYRRLDPHAIIRPAMHHVGDAYAAFDVFVTTSDDEGGPLTNLEAMIAGVPLVTTPVGQMPEIQQRHGPLFESIPLHPSDGEVAEGILRALQPRQRQRSRRAQQVALEHYSAQRMAADWASYLTRAAACQSRPANALAAEAVDRTARQSRPRSPFTR
jgi:glycosyltransferase involved in cell wall biosynthesis